MNLLSLAIHGVDLIVLIQHRERILVPTLNLFPEMKSGQVESYIHFNSPSQLESWSHHPILGAERLEDDFEFLDFFESL